MTRRYVYIIAAVLAGISLTTFFYKWQVLGFPLTGNQQLPVWTIETSIRFDAGPGSIKSNLQIPTLTPGFRTLREFNVSKGYGFSLNYVSGGREAQWAVRRTGGRQTLYYRRVVYEDSSSEQIDTTPPFPPPPVINEPLRTAVDVIVEDVRAHSADTASFTTELLRRCNDPSPDANIELLLADANTSAQFVETVTIVLAAARIPARMIRGVILQDQQRRVEPTPWLEVHDGDRWRYFNPDTGAEGLPSRYLIWWRGNEPLVRVEGGSNVEVNFAVQKNFLDSMSIAEQRAQVEGSLLVDFSLFSLPIQTQAVYSVLLMIPIGALIMVIMRNVRETQLLWGVILFTLLVALGLSIRFLLDRLRLLLVPRLGAVLIVVVVLMLIISVVSHKLGLETGLSVALFPMVIIVMTIERMSVVWEERGAGDAIKAGLGSLLVAAIAYLAMGMDWLEHLIFAFPELLLLILAAVLLLGRYTGYRLTELRRFRPIASE
jgi:hypothetical protein